MSHVETTTPNGAHKLYFAAWRWHFYAGLYVIPFLVMLACSGLMILWFTTIAPEYGDGLAVPQGDKALTLTAQEAAARGTRLAAPDRAELMMAQAMADADGDGTASAAELRAMAEAEALRASGGAEAAMVAALMAFDADGDARLTVAEVEAAFAAMETAG